MQMFSLKSNRVRNKSLPKRVAAFADEAIRIGDDRQGAVEQVVVRDLGHRKSSAWRDRK